MFQRNLRKIIPKTLKPNKFQEKQGQSLVEFAITLPLILLMLLGVFEVGWALRGYLVLANVNREATRFAARGVYLDFDQKYDISKVGYEKVVTHTLDSMSEQLSMDIVGPDPNGMMITTYYEVDPRNFHCLGDASCANFDCGRFGDASRADYVPGEDINTIEYPLLVPPPGSETDPNLPAYYGKVLSMANTTPVTTYHHHQGAPIFSRIDPEEKVIELRSRNNEVNCQLVQKGLPPNSTNHVVIVENVYLQEQLGAFPFVTAFVPDPVPFYTHTAMRLTDEVRASNRPKEGVCELYPIMIPMSKINNTFQGDDIVIPIENNANAPGNFSYVQWDAYENHSDGELGDNLLNPNNATTNFKEAGDPNDTQINIGDWIESKPGTHASNEVTDALDILVANETYMRMPVWNDSDCPTPCINVQNSGANVKFQTAMFVVMKIVEVDYTGNPKQIKFQFSHFDTSACPGDDQP